MSDADKERAKNKGKGHTQRKTGGEYDVRDSLELDRQKDTDYIWDDQTQVDIMREYR